MPMEVQPVGRFGDDARIPPDDPLARHRYHGEFDDLPRASGGVLMDDRVAAIIGIVIMLAFAGGIAWKVGAFPLLIITIAVLGMAVFDVVRTLRGQV